MVEDLCPEGVSTPLQHSALLTEPVSHFQLDNTHFIPAILKARLSTCDDIQTVFLQLNSVESTHHNSHAPLLSHLLHDYHDSFFTTKNLLTHRVIFHATTTG